MRNATRPRLTLGILAILLAAGFAVTSIASVQEKIGFDDTPYLPGQEWRVHDYQRPYPPVVTPGSLSQPGLPPSDAVVLFNGKDLSNWLTDGKDGKPVPAQWKVENGYMEVVGNTGAIYSKEKFGDCQLHIEWTSPVPPVGTSQGRGNSGVILMGFYEIQVLDSYQNLTYADGQAGAMYGQYPPLANPARKPGEWQTYDIIFTAPVFEGEKVVKPARVTLLFNGVLVHHDQPFIGRMTYRQVATYAPHGPAGPLMLQDHGNPVRYRNIWVRKLGKYDGK